MFAEDFMAGMPPKERDEVWGIAAQLKTRCSAYQVRHWLVIAVTIHIDSSCLCIPLPWHTCLA